MKVILDTSAALENVCDSVEVKNATCENTGEHFKILVKESLIQCGLKQLEQRFYEEDLKFLHERKQAKLQ